MIDFSKLSIGDYVEVIYTEGTWSKGSKVSGTITKIWDAEETGFEQAQVNNGWCFHRHDDLVKHIKRDDIV